MEIDVLKLPAKPCCVQLRCKSMYYRTDERPGLLHVEEQMGYWCGKTNDMLGPEDLLASHANCQQGRQCYVAGPDLGSALA